jgi:hypothetical protein
VVKGPKGVVSAPVLSSSSTGNLQETEEGEEKEEEEATEEKNP